MAGENRQCFLTAEQAAKKGLEVNTPAECFELPHRQATFDQLYKTGRIISAARLFSAYAKNTALGEIASSASEQLGSSPNKQQP